MKVISTPIERVKATIKANWDRAKLKELASDPNIDVEKLPISELRRYRFGLLFLIGDINDRHTVKKGETEVVRLTSKVVFEELQPLHDRIRRVETLIKEKKPRSVK